MKNRAFTIIGALLLPAVVSVPIALGEAAHPSLGGTTGLFNVPTAEVTSEGTFYFGYNVFAKEWAYEGRGHLDNRVWFFTLGFLPRVEVSVRATVLPGQSLLEDVKVDALDRMGSGRVQLLKEKKWPALAVGIDDVKGTRRFHSLYGVATRTVNLRGTIAKFSAGYGLRSLHAARYLLDGGFGGVNVQPFPWISGVAEYDSEKWNAGLRLTLFSRVDLQLAYLDMKTASGGLSIRYHF